VKPVPGKCAEDYRIYASYRISGDRKYYGTLRVQRIADKRLLYPFDGCPDIGPSDGPQPARQAALDLGAKLVAADIKNPEL